MTPKAQKAPEKVTKTGGKTVSVTLRVRRDHQAELDKIANRKGIIRSAAIQIAIAEFIEREHRD
jgi:predicted transcriptional regulator